MTESSTHQIEFVINNNKFDQDTNTRRIDVHATPDELSDFERDGFLVRKGLFSDAQLDDLRAALDELEASERAAGSGDHREGNGFFIRALHEKHPLFRDLMIFEPTLSVTRAMLGPQVTSEVDARIVYEGETNQLVPWHIHRRVVPTPMPPFFSYPHGVHCLLYLNDVGPDEGPLVVLPGSHRQHDVDLPYRGSPDIEGQLTIAPEAGDVVMIHSNLWHRTVPTSANSERRRLVLIGYDPAWLTTNPAQGDLGPLTTPLAESDDPGEREVVGGFSW